METPDFSKDIWEYIQLHSSPEDPVLERLTRYTHLKVVHPRMLSGQVQGKFLEFISRMMRPSYILEIGTYTGYSAICLARGLKESGKLVTIEINEELETVSSRFIAEAGLSDRIESIFGNALDIIPSLKDGIDLVFMDGEKEQYELYFNAVFPKLRHGGFIIADNTLWDGKVAFETQHKDSASKALRSFNLEVQNNPAVENIILPVRDGLSLIRKL